MTLFETIISAGSVMIAICGLWYIRYIVRTSGRDRPMIPQELSAWLRWLGKTDYSFCLQAYACPSRPTFWAQNITVPFYRSCFSYDGRNADLRGEC